MSLGSENLVRLTHLDATLREDGPYTYVRHFHFGSPGPTSQYTEWKREIKRLGRGAFGEVYLETCVRGSGEGAVRAVKVFSKFGFSNAPKIDYGRELEAIARFSQTKYEDFFVTSTGWYESNDAIHLTMEYVEHGDLQRYIESGLPEREVQTLIRQVMQGLSMMHAAGYAHRDLKPQNLLVVRKGPSWLIKLADFGLSKRVSDGLSSFRTVAGTPVYMAPELYGLGAAADLDDDSDDESESYSNAVDIWAAGIILFQLVTGTVPFQNEKYLRRYVRGKLPFPRDAIESKLEDQSGLELVELLLKPEPNSRPNAVEILHHAWLGDPQTNSTHGASYQTVLSIGSTKLSIPASARWSSTNSGDIKAVDSVTGNIITSQRRSSAGQSDGPLDTQSTIDESQDPSSLVPRDTTLPSSPILKRRIEIEIVKCISIQQSSPRPNWSLSFSPNGQSLAGCAKHDFGGQLFIVKTTDWSVCKTFEFDEPVESCAISPDNHTIAISGSKLRLWDVDRETELWARERETFNSKFEGDQTFSLDGKTLAVAYGSQLEFWNIATQHQRNLKVPADFSHDDETTWPHVPQWRKNTAITGWFSHSINVTACSPDGQLLAVMFDGILRLWQVTKPGHYMLRQLRMTMEEVIDLNVPMHSSIGGVSFSPNSQILAVATGTYDTSQTAYEVSIWLWETATGKLIRRLDGGHSDSQLAHVSFLPNNQTLILQTAPMIIFIDSQTGEQLETVPAPKELAARGFMKMAYSPSNNLLAVSFGWSDQVFVLRVKGTDVEQVGENRSEEDRLSDPAQSQPEGGQRKWWRFS